MIKNIAITGTTRGIGLEIAKQLSREYNVVHLNRPEFDLSNLKQMSSIDFSTTDALILNAGVLDKAIINSPFETHDSELWQYILKCNLLGNLCLIQQYIKCREQGTVIFISGATVTRRKEGSTSIIHTLGKKAMSAFIEDIRYEMHTLNHSIRFVDVKPGLTKKDKTMIDSTGRVPSTYEEVAKGIKFALENPAILNIDFEKHEAINRGNQ